MEEKKIDWKVKFIYNMNVEFTVSGGLIAIPRSQNGVLLEFGKTNMFTYRQSTLDRKLSKKVFPDLNTIMFQFRQ